MSNESLERPYDIIAFGDVCVDLIIPGDDIVPQFGQVEKLVGDYVVEMGGSGAIFACQAANLGVKDQPSPIFNIGSGTFHTLGAYLYGRSRHVGFVAVCGKGSLPLVFAPRR